MITLDLLIHDTNGAIGRAKYYLQALKRADITLTQEQEYNNKILENLKEIQDIHDQFYKYHKEPLKQHYKKEHELANNTPNTTNTLGS